MPISLLFAFIVAVLPSSVAGHIDNSDIPIMAYAYERAVEQGINPHKFFRLINCESRWNPKAKGDYRIEEDRYMARGILQFWKSTYNTYAKKYDLSGSYENPYSQILLASIMLSKEKDGWRHWYNCWKKVGA